MTAIATAPTLYEGEEELFYLEDETQLEDLVGPQKSSPPHSRSEFLYGLLQANIYTAVSWQGLETCTARARKAYEQGKLNTSQVENLMEHAILVSRYVPEE